MNKIIRPGTIPTYGGSRVSVFCHIEYKDRRLSITGVIGPRPSGNAYGGCGQIDMEFEHRNKLHNDSRYGELIKASDFNFAPGWSSKLWYDFLEVWKMWHLNDLHAECEHQEKLGWTYDTHKGQKCPECGYQIGTAWTFRNVPQSVLNFLQSLPDTDKQPAWV